MQDGTIGKTCMIDGVTYRVDAILFGEVNEASYYVPDVYPEDPEAIRCLGEWDQCLNWSKLTRINEIIRQQHN